NTIGEAGVKFLKDLDKNTRVSVTTTLNPMGYDSKLDNDLSGNFKEKQRDIISSYTQLGVNPTFTCIPYEIFDLPKDSNVSFAESNAAVFSNSILGIKTNKESAISALASALTGKVPYSDLLIDEMRKPRIKIKLETKVESETDYGLLGYFAGKTINENSVGIEKIQDLNLMNGKALSAGLGTSGMCGMFSIKNNNNAELISFGKEEMKKTREELDTAEKGELIVFGSPQLGHTELYNLCKITEGKTFKKKCMIFCPRIVSDSVQNRDIIHRLEKAGAEIICDACTCLTPLITRDNFDSIVTNSIKCAYYMKKSNKIDVALKDMRTIVKEYCE
ncbi:MAG: aconitase X, partial [Nitrososphaeraceae archaeon]|nr:aconitase X [Nitrososphaeraceae archaeon]